MESCSRSHCNRAFHGFHVSYPPKSRLKRDTNTRCVVKDNLAVFSKLSNAFVWLKTSSAANTLSFDLNTQLAAVRFPADVKQMLSHSLLH